MFKIVRDLSAGANLETNVPAFVCNKISAVLLGILCLCENRQYPPFSLHCSKVKLRDSVFSTTAQYLGCLVRTEIVRHSCLLCSVQLMHLSTSLSGLKEGA